MIVNVPPCTSSRRSFLERALCDIDDALRDAEQVERLGVLQHGDDETLPVPASSTAKPMLMLGRVTMLSPRISPLTHG